MADEVTRSPESESGAGFSRRNALKAGVAAGVGVAAWSGATITSLGGTPAYAAGCTGVINIDLSGGCRNTDQGTPCAGGDPFRFHVLKDTGLPAGFSLTNNISEGTCCNVPSGSDPIFNFPSGLTCNVILTFSNPPQCATLQQPAISLGQSSTGTLTVDLKCPTLAIKSSTQYTIVAKCATTGAPNDCIQ
jgi:hypothetical protein